MKRFFDFLDDRTGYRTLVAHALDEEIKGGARMAYVFGSVLLAVLSLQLVTGLLLMFTYSPSVDSAWASTYFIQHRMTFGWVIRGLHHYGAQAMVLALGFHIIQVAMWGAYKKPREVTWWVGLVLLGLVQGLALTGYLLPWDQKGYWATKVATNIAATVPVVGESIQNVLVGGSEYGQQTLTRFYALHVGILPLTILGDVGLHVLLFRRHGVTASERALKSPSEPFFPGQLGKDVIASVVVVGAMFALTVATRGAGLDAPADPGSDYPPRPEWYFLFLFQLLKYIPGELELVGTVVLPGLAMMFLAALPLLDRSESRALRTRWKWMLPLAFGGVAIVGLTAAAFSDDAKDPKYQEARRDADVRARRAVTLAGHGIPPEGPVAMLENDPMTRGRDLYAQYCTSCHVLDGEGEQKAPTHTGFASREWLVAFMKEPRAPHFFGETDIDDMPSQSRLGDDKLRAVAEFLVAEGREQHDPAVDAALVRDGETTFRSKCMECHTYRGEGDDMGTGGPNLTGYASRTWIYRQMARPDSADQYGELNEMPAFGEDLTEHDMWMVAGYLRQQRFATFSQ